MKKVTAHIPMLINDFPQLAPLAFQSGISFEVPINVSVQNCREIFSFVPFDLQLLTEAQMNERFGLGIEAYCHPCKNGTKHIISLKAIDPQKYYCRAGLLLVQIGQVVEQLRAGKRCLRGALAMRDTSFDDGCRLVSKRLGLPTENRRVRKVSDLLVSLINSRSLSLVVNKFQRNVQAELLLQCATNPELRVVILGSRELTEFFCSPLSLLRETPTHLFKNPRMLIELDKFGSTLLRSSTLGRS